MNNQKNQLQLCPACNGTVSVVAETCPHCGYPIAKMQRKAAFSNAAGKTYTCVSAAFKAIKPIGIRLARIIAFLCVIAVFACINGFLGISKLMIAHSFSDIYGFALLAPLTIHLPIVYFSRKIIGPKTSFYLGRTLVVIMSLSIIANAETIHRVYMHYLLLSGNPPATNMALLYAICAGIQAFWVFIIWHQTSIAKAMFVSSTQKTETESPKSKEEAQ